MGGTAIEDEIDRVAELIQDGRRIRRLGQARHVGRRGRQRAEDAGERPRCLVVRDAETDRRATSPEVRAAGSDTSGRSGTTTVSPPGQQPRASASAGGVMIPISAAWSAPSSSSMIPLSGGRRFTRKRRSTPPGVSSATLMP